MKIFVINGSGGSGKDTFIEIFKEKYDGKTKNISTVDKIKEVARDYFYWDGSKKERDRKFMSDLKDLATEYCDAPFRYISNSIKLFGHYDMNDTVVFIHCREPKEIDRIVETFAAKTILIDARERVPAINSNHADSDVYEYAYDYIIDNNGSRKQLECAVECFLEMIEEKSSLS